MKKKLLQIKLAGTVGGISGAIGSLFVAWSNPTTYRLAAGFLLGFTMGFVIVYRIGGMMKTVESILIAERFSAGVDMLAIVVSCIFAIAGLILLILYGWNTTIFISTLFALQCALYLGYKRYQT